jgi:Holliday junction DNA helicase RuvA
VIARLTGLLLSKEPGRVILDVRGVGYEVHIPLSTFYVLPEASTDVTLEIYTHLREDAITLFGFASAVEKALFERLISVSGVGPKLACTVLSGLPPGEVVAAVRSGEAAHLRAVPGIGRRTAERIIVELRDRLDALAGPGEGPVVPAPPGDAIEDAVSALRNLGYREASARRAVRRATAGGADAAASLEGLLRESLRVLAAGGADA